MNIGYTMMILGTIYFFTQGHWIGGGSALILLAAVIATEFTQTYKRRG